MKYTFKSKLTNASIPCNSLAEVRKSPLFTHWGDDFNLICGDMHDEVKMVQDGLSYKQGVVVGWYYKHDAYDRGQYEESI